MYIAVLASGQPQDFSEWIGAQAAQAQHLATFGNTATAEELAAFAKVMGTAPDAAALPAAFPTSTQTPGEYYVDYQRETTKLDQAIDAVDGVINETANANASVGPARGAHLRRRRGVRHAAHAPPDLVRVPRRGRSDPPPHRRRPRDVAAAAPGARRVAPHRWRLSASQPTRIEVQSEDEIGELAQAFNDVEAVTLQVAQEQSALLRKGMGDLFVNLARRNQSLVQRQLELLDDLERNEHDPAALDALFKLDHMATRMRRNAESLLVLSGAEQPRQWQQPIALIDVVRAAAAEIADFPRVELVGIDDDLAVSGRAVSDVAHLLAELLENATSFSPPDTAVVVSGAVSATGFVLAVSDQGIGMPPDRIAEANALLAEPPVVGLALSRALGLHVVGSLAARHGITRGAASRCARRLSSPWSALPTAVLEPRPVSAPAARRADAPTRSTRPTVDDRGEAEPLGARRLVSRPPDEPPVEEWRWEGLDRRCHAEPTTGRARAPLDDLTPCHGHAPTYDATTYDVPPRHRPTTRRRTTRRRTTRRPTHRRARRSTTCRRRATLHVRDDASRVRRRLPRTCEC